MIYVTGQFRSYNRHEEKRNRLVLSVFAREMEFIEEELEEHKSNQIYLDGFVCKDPIYRKTPLGREIADLLVAVNRSYGIWGRIQSREYMKKTGENLSEKRTAYEVSVSKVERLE